MIFDEFRLLVQPDLQTPGQWSIHVQRAPMQELSGPHGPVPPQVNQADLSHLRNPTAPPNLNGLKQLGQKVLDSIMPSPLQFGFRACLNQARANNRGLRLVVTTLGNGKVVGGIGGRELPLEVAFNQNLSFLAANLDTPVSRGVAADADRQGLRITPPLRILVVVSEPSDLSPVNAAAERAAILAALQPLLQTGTVSIDFCDPPTQMRLDALLQERPFHVVHFIGHGDFEIVGLDPDPQPHLYFEDGTPARQRRAVDAQQLFTVLRNGNVPLVVLTACASAAAAPNGADYPGMAFEGLAQSLVERDAGPLAVVAMQFDLEAIAAPVFSGSFYQHLLVPDSSVDQAVNAARSAMMLQLGAGHRSWVNPTVYWRCKEGRVFELVKSAPLPPDIERQLVELSSLIGAYETQLRDLARESSEIQEATARLRAQWQAKIQELMDRRADLLGDLLRLHGASAAPDQTVECVLSLRLLTGGKVGDVRATLRFDGADLELIGSSEGADAPAGSLFLQAQPGKPPVVLVHGVSAGAIWPPGRHELARLRFRFTNSGSNPAPRIGLDNVSLSRDHTEEHDFRALHAIVFKP